MSLINTWYFTKTIVLRDIIAQYLFNQFRVVTVRDYVDKKGELPDGITMILTVLKDDFDYGIDKKTGKPRDSNLHMNFEVTVLNRKHQIKKGDIVSLLDFDSENSYAIGFDLLLRFGDLEIVKSQGEKNA